jgi:uroporphyrinogen-III synthase
MTADGLNGLRVLALESRRSEEIARLIRNHGGKPTIAPAMREVPLEANTEALEFAGGLIRGDYDLVVFLTGSGVQRLVDIAGLRYDRNVFLEALRRVKVASRGSKVNATLRQLGVSVAVTAPEPCTWRELMSALDGVFGSSLAGMRAAVQEYGAPNFDLLRSLSERQVQWTRIPVYHWALPDDLEPLKNAIREIASGALDVIVFLTRTQVTHLFQVAEQMEAAGALRVGMKQALLLSIGPSTTE